VAQIQQIKRRIRSVGNTRQITKAMELVSASKLRRASEAHSRSSAYTSSAREILVRLSQLTDASTHPYFQQREIKNRLVIVFASDRTLAGAYNSNITKMLTQVVQAGSTQIIAVGKQVAQFAARLDGVELVGSYTDWPTEPTSADIRPITHVATKLFTEGSVDEVVVIYTEFVSSITQQATQSVLLPISLEHETEGVEIGASLDEAIFEPSAEAVLEAMMPRLVEAALLGTALHAAASEHAMRMLAMKNASDNANDLIDDLTLVYNGARQAGITQELAEITGGAEAVA
jgi:F-type H+-transporting ATPase subunit gamma